MVKQHSKVPAILITVFAAFGGFLFGYDTGNISGVIAMEFFRRNFGEFIGVSEARPNGYDLSTSNKSLTVSILSAGTFCGALTGAPVADFFGRRLGLLLTMVIFSVGVALQTASTALPLFIVGRVVAGFGVGLVSTMVPMYQSECAPKWIRGAVVSCYQWAITIGLLVASIATNGTKDFNDASCYRIPIGLQIAWAAILSLGLFFLPESPRFYIKKGKYEKAAMSLARLNATTPDDVEVQEQLNEIRANLEVEQAHSSGSWLDCFRPGGSQRHLLRTFTGTILQGWQQLTGINFIFYYGTTFFLRSGISNPFIISIATNVVNVGTTVFAFWGIEKLGRRKLLIIGAIGMSFCEFIVAIVGVTTPAGNLAAQKVLIAFVCIYIAFFASTWGPVCWVVCGEIFPLTIRAKGMALSAASNWLWNFGIGYATPYMVDSGPGNADLGVKVFFIWGSTCAAAGLFAFFFVPETKGLTLEEIDELYATTTIRNSSKFRPSHKYVDDVEMGAGNRVISNEGKTDAAVREHREMA
ncbi:MFS monosaccharide transporter [Protomyces lactucae-debilis]|uniref:MFS monosaccharide transporter n=1 Tax=Protomyces lactucae-debilis TaxID=2754530 RepID=A0A1Y2FVB3_PROLT|nr:MFS monosaccharide transporter [Protomyces lactucae-debilis]ORY87126.1 MFS monosaccharide transporter [Protomyces lactucae-debilis]